MARWRVFEFLDENHHSTIKAWLKANRIPAAQVAVFRDKVMALKRDADLVAPGLIEGPIKKVKPGEKTTITGIYKMKIRGNKGWVQLRPLLCYGPLPSDDMDTTITFLAGAIEENSLLKPDDCLKRADRNREVIKNEPTRRRNLKIPHMG